MTEPILSRSQERRISVQKGTVTPERLAEILKEKSSGLSFDLSFKQYFKNFATELSKALDIREKE
jgi:hypothetical protein